MRRGGVSVVSLARLSLSWVDEARRLSVTVDPILATCQAAGLLAAEARLAQPVFDGAGETL